MAFFCPGACCIARGFFTPEPRVNPYCNPSSTCNNTPMTQTKSLDSYPPVFAAAVKRAFERGEFIIPTRTASATTLRMQMFGYLRTLRANGQGEMADAIYITDLPEKAGIKLIHRESSPVALDIAAALGVNPPDLTPALFDAESAFFDKLD